MPNPNSLADVRAAATTTIQRLSALVRDRLSDPGEILTFSAQIGLALAVAFLWDLIKSAPARYRRRIFASLERAIPTAGRDVLYQRRDGMLSDDRDQHATAVEAVLSNYCPAA